MREQDGDDPALSHVLVVQCLMMFVGKVAVGDARIGIERDEPRPHHIVDVANVDIKRT